MLMTKRLDYLWLRGCDTHKVQVWFEPTSLIVRGFSADCDLIAARIAVSLGDDPTGCLRTVNTLRENLRGRGSTRQGRLEQLLSAATLRRTGRPTRIIQSDNAAPPGVVLQLKYASMLHQIAEQFARSLSVRPPPVSVRMPEQLRKRWLVRIGLVEAYREESERPWHSGVSAASNRLANYLNKEVERMVYRGGILKGPTRP